MSMRTEERDVTVKRDVRVMACDNADCQNSTVCDDYRMPPEEWYALTPPIGLYLHFCSNACLAEWAGRQAVKQAVDAI